MASLENPVRFGVISHAKNPVLNSRLPPLQNSVTTTSFSCTGPQGFQGPIGYLGKMGDRGDMGEMGPQGPEGICSCSPKDSLDDNRTPDEVSETTPKGTREEKFLIESDETVSIEGQTPLIAFELQKGSHIVYCISTYYSNGQSDVHLEFNILDEDGNKVNKNSYYNTSKKSSGYTTFSIPIFINAEKDIQSFSFVVKGKDGCPVKVSLSQVIIQ